MESARETNSITFDYVKESDEQLDGNSLTLSKTTYRIFEQNINGIKTDNTRKY